jgi:divalent metal cation (Fe/Co/Zn/Cd) transporter
MAEGFAAVGSVKNYKSAVQKALILAFVSIALSLSETVAGLFFGFKEQSVTLFGFGLDSVAEVGSALLVLWRFYDWESHDEAKSTRRERTATGWIGALLAGFGVSIVVAAACKLFWRSHPEAALPGIVISLVSLIVMAFLWGTKRKVARHLDSSSVLKDSGCSLACMQLSVVVLASSVFYLASPSLWWVDGVAGLLVGALVTREGVHSLIAVRRPAFKGTCGCVHH